MIVKLFRLLALLQGGGITDYFLYFNNINFKLVKAKLVTRTRLNFCCYFEMRKYSPKLYSYSCTVSYNSNKLFDYIRDMFREKHYIIINI